MSQHPPSLRDALVQAQSGYRSDVSALAKQLNANNVFAPLARGVGLRLTGPLPAGTSLVVHDLVSDNGAKWIPLFSSVQALRTIGGRLRWHTDGGLLNYAEFRWDEAFEAIFRSVLESGDRAGVVFDAGTPSELALTRHEALTIAGGAVIPLVDYASRQPTRPADQVYVGEPAAMPSEDLLQGLRVALSVEPRVRSYRLVQVFMPERDVIPHLVLDIRSDALEEERRQIAQRIGDAILRIPVPPPGYVDIAFNLGE